MALGGHVWSMYWMFVAGVFTALSVAAVPTPVTYVEKSWFYVGVGLFTVVSSVVAAYFGHLEHKSANTGDNNAEK